MKTFITTLFVTTLLMGSSAFAQTHNAATHTGHSSAQPTDNASMTQGHGHSDSHAEADQVTAGDLTLSKAFSQATIPNARVAAGYLVITNNGKEADRLIGGNTDASGKLEIHEMSMKDNVMKMRKLTEPLAIPAGQSVTLAPTGFHIMFMDLKEPFKEGEGVPVTLEFEKAGKVNISFHVNPANGKSHH